MKVIRFPYEKRRRQVATERMERLSDTDNFQGVFTMNIVTVGK